MRLAGADARMAALGAAGVALGTWALYLAIQVAPPEKELGMSQKIFYFHAPLGIWAIAGVCAAAACGAAYLARRRPRLDLACASLMEVATVLCAVVLVTGCIWARYAWGDWFPWGEPRVTSILVLFLIGLAFAVVRSSVDEPERRARFSSVVAVVGSLDALLAYFAIHIWNTQHPKVITLGAVHLEARMKHAFVACVGATALLSAALLAIRYRLACAEAGVLDLEARAERHGPGDPLS